MNERERKEIDRIERQRKRREEALFLLMLFCIGGVASFAGVNRRNPRSARAMAAHAVLMGMDPAIAIRNAVMGNEALHLPGIVGLIANAMADTAVAGLNNVFDQAKLPRPADLPSLEYIARLLDYDAKIRAQEIADQLTKMVLQTIYDATQAKMRTTQIAREVYKAFTRYGWTQTPPQTVNHESKGSPGFAAETAATNTVLDAWKRGAAAGWRDRRILSVLAGWTFMNPLDKSTSLICWDRAGPPNGPMMVHKDDSWILRNNPPLHGRCRSVLLGVFGHVDESEWSTSYPMTEPEPGWGEWPLPIFPPGMTL